jgi:two-component system sensor histidine kinase PilS (NtrC family)
VLHRAAEAVSPREGSGVSSGLRSERDLGFERRLIVLMAARLILSAVSLGVTLGLEAAGENFTTAEWRGFYATIAFAFLATIVYGVVLHRVVHPGRFAALNVVTDVAIVTALVQFSGGHDSVFPFLYVLVAAYGGFLFEFRGAVGTAGLAIAAYGGVLFAGHLGWIPSLAIGPPKPVALLLTSWVVNGGAVAIVAILANLLTLELRRTGEALDQRTTDLQRLQSLHQSTVKSLMSGLLTTDQLGCVTSFNPEAERITGRSCRDAIGRDAEDIIPGIRELAISATDGGGGENSRRRMPYRNERGEELHLGLAAYVLKDADGAAFGFVVIFQDVTSVVEMEQELRRSERLAAVGELSASIAHEVRNPLAAISGSIQILRNLVARQGAEREPRRLMEIAIRETDRLNRLITDFLQYARPGPLNPEPIIVAEAVEDVLKMFESVRPQNVAVSVEVEEGLRVVADSSQLRQVLWNLVLNAAEAMAEGGGLLVSAGALPGEAPQASAHFDRNEAMEQKKSDWAEIAIADRGEGVPPDVVERIFDPFFTTKKRGSGLGLAAVHRIVEDHGGSVRLESTVGEGTTVRLRFPRSEKPS